MMRILRFLTAAALLVLTATQAQATHAYGGEITWKCFTTGPNAGKFKFYMILYRDCGMNNASLPGGTVILNSNSSAGNITLSQVGSNADVSPTCYITPSPIRCNVAASGQGALEEARFESAYLNLTGTPPAGGWTFSYQLCCRPNTLTNLVNPGGADLYLRAVMYPYSINGTPQNTNPCYDSSPRFLEPPKSVICTGYEYTYAQFAFDDDLDSIYYDWAPSLDAGGATISYTTGYSSTSPLPNGGVPAQLNNVTGNITLTPSSGGSFATSIKVSAYRCGQKIAEVFRDIPMAIRSDCPNLPTGQPNTPPTLAIANIPGFPPITPVIINNDTAYYEATVFAGQQVRFNLVSQDPQLLPNFLPQTIAFQPSGGQFGVPFTNTASGCLNPPCATVVPVAPQATLTNPLNNEVLFNWQTSCNHIAYQGTQCGTPTNQYTFAMRMQDNFCPIPAVSVKSVLINVVSTIPVPPDMSNACVSLNTSGGIDLSWGYPVDTGMNFDAYVIYHSTNPTAPFAVLDTVFNYNQLSYTHNAPGTGAHYYYIRTKGGCGYISVPTDTLQTIQMALTSLPPTNSYVADLAWNASSSSYNQGYEVWRRQLPAGAWGMIATTNSLTYRDTVNVCGQNLEYQIRTVSGCSSTKDSDFFSDQVNNDQLVIDSVTTQNGEVFMAWTPGSSNDIVDYYVLRRDAAGNWVPIDTVKPGATMPYKIKGSVETVKDFYKVVSTDSCGNISSDLLVRAANNIVLTENMDPCEGVMRLRWNTYKGWGAVKNYQIWMEETPNGGATVVSMIGTVGPNDSTFNQRNLNGGTTYCYYIKAVDTSETLYSSSNRICINSLAVQRSRLLYLAKASVREDRAVELVCFIDKDADIVDFDVQRADELGGPFRSLGRLPKPITGPWEFRYKDFTANPEDHRYVYRIVATDSCGNIDTASNIGRTMVLEVEENDNLTNFLTWNPYQDYMGGVDRYEIYRAVMPNGGYQLMGSTADTFFLDNTRPLGDYSGLVQYRVVAVEGPNPLVFRDADGSIFRSTSSVAVAEFAPRVFIPNSFNPKSDVAANRVWKPAQAYVSSGSYSLEIFDRWGQLVFETKNENKAWDGRMNGEFAPSGVYTYQLRYRSIEGEVVERRGTLNLLY
jgi:gliding motility-associated-like protein